MVDATNRTSGGYTAMPRFASLRNAWLRQSPRDQALLGVTVAAIALSVTWLLLRPLAADSLSLERDLARDRSLLTTVRGQADDITSLARNPVKAPTAEALQSVERIMNEQGLRSAVTSIEAADGRVRITFAAVRFDALLSLLDALSRGSNLRAVEMTLTPRVEPGTVRAEMALSR